MANTISTLDFANQISLLATAATDSFSVVTDSII